jgi:hypothetical protein
MAFTKVGNATVAVPLPNGAKRYVTIGSILENDQNDPAKGLPYMLMLDPWIDLAALYRASDADGGSIPVSFYKASRNPDWPPRASAPNLPPASTRRSTGFELPDDDIPF